MTLAEFMAARLDERERGTEIGSQYLSHALRLREVAAMRSVLARCLQVIAEDANDEGTAMGWSDGWSGLSVAYLDLADLGTVWSDHPDYQREWKP